MKLFRKFKPSGLINRNQIAVHELKMIRCENCDHEFIGHFCPVCGQEVAEFNRPMGFVYTILSAIFLRSIPVFFRPFGIW